MKIHQVTIRWSAKELLSIVLSLCLIPATGQIIKNNANEVRSDTMRRKKSAADERFIKSMAPKTTMVKNNAPVDSVTSLDGYLQMKADCDITKSIDDDGRIMIRYPDGFIKKFSNGIVVEVITPDGVRHVPKHPYYPPTIRLAVIQIPPPVPGTNDPIYLWLVKFRADLETDIRRSIGGGDARWQQFLSDENTVCQNNIYKQIQFRTAFLENYATAQ
ncbi:MAG: hypothetical protein JST42_29200 [Bacteroidetes bacterium]|nr:hypothetical protein [Bacteroidota bacterium]